MVRVRLKRTRRGPFALIPPRTLFSNMNSAEVFRRLGEGVEQLSEVSETARQGIARAIGEPHRVTRLEVAVQALDCALQLLPRVVPDRIQPVARRGVQLHVLVDADPY